LEPWPQDSLVVATTDLGEPNAAIRTATVSWTAVPGATRYVVSWPRETGSGWVYQQVRASESSYSLPLGVDLTQVRVRYRIGSAKSDWQSPVISTGVPQSVVVVRDGNVLSVAWEPDPYRTAEVQRFALWYRPVGSNGGGTYRWAAADATSRDIDLGPGQAATQFEVRMRAVYPVDQRSDRSAWVAETRQAAPVDATSLCEPGGAIFNKIEATEAYAEVRVPLEGQVWFFPTDRDQDGAAENGQSFGHAHLLTCAPLPIAEGGEAIQTDTLRLDIHIQAHLMPADQLDRNEGIKLPTQTRVVVDEIENLLNAMQMEVWVG